MSVGWAEDMLAITDLVARIAQLADNGPIDTYMTCYTPDAVWELTDASGLELTEQVRRGVEDIREGVVERRAAGVQGPGSNTKHDISTIAVDVDVAGQTALCTSYFKYFSATNGVPLLVMMGRYEDEFVRGPDGWLLARRVIRRD